MTRVANLAQFQLSQANIQRTQSALAQNQIQLATGKVAQSYSEIPTLSNQLVSLERSLQRGDQFLDNINQAQTRLNSTESALSTLVDRAIDIKSIISQGLNNNSIDDLPLQSFARSFAEEIAGLLNSQLGGRYIFGGSRSDRAPVDLTDPAYTPQAGLPGAFTPDAGYYQGDDLEVSVRAGENFEISYGVNADDPAFEELLRAVSYLDFAGQNSDKSVLEQAMTLVSSAIEGLSDLRSEVGANSQILQKASDGHEDFKTFATNIVSSIEDVDIAQATTELAFNENQLRGSFLSLTRLNNLSLLQFL